MTRSRWFPICLLLWCVASAEAKADDALSIKLETPRQLQLGPSGYRGKVKVSLQNRGSHPLTLHHGEENYLVFDDGSGKPDLICHPCACVMGSATGATSPFTVTLQPGAKKELVFADWGCGGSSWRGPPPGKYRVTYRVFRERPRHTADPRTCCDSLRKVDFWKGAISSPAVTVAVMGRSGAPKSKAPGR